MKKPSSKKVTGQWFYLGCLVMGAALGPLVTSFVSSSRPRSDHPSSALAVPGVVPWDTLSKVSFVEQNGKSVLQFGQGIQALDGKEVKLRGYITPLELGASQKHFLLSTKPPSCAYCLPAGADETVEVFSKNSVAYSLDPVTLAGRFAVVGDDAGGLFYRMADAEQVTGSFRRDSIAPSVQWRN